jgi:hypothetical protein
VLGDPRMMKALGVIMGINMSGSMNDEDYGDAHDHSHADGDSC